MSGNSILSDTILSQMQKGLDTSLKRQNILSSNLSNLETPNYTPRDIKFKEALKGSVQKSVALDGSAERHFEPETEPDPAPTFKRPDGPAGPDGNSVNLDTQMARLAQNSMLYNATTKVVSKKMATLKYVISNAG